MRALLLFLLISLTTEAISQPYSFIAQSRRDYILREDGDQIFCLFLVSRGMKTVYRKAFLDSALHMRNSVIYKIPGEATLIQSGRNSSITWHVFSTEQNGDPAWYFLITKKDGTISNAFIKNVEDFRPYFKGLTGLGMLRMEFIQDSNPDLFIMDLVLKGDEDDQSRIIALNTHDGKLIWQSNALKLDHLTTTDSLLFGISTTKHKGTTSMNVNVISKQNGKLVNEFPLMKMDGGREIEVMTWKNGRLLIAGYETGKGTTAKGAHWFVMMYDKNGNKLLDKVDSSDRENSYRRKVMGSVWNNHGNLLLLDQAYTDDRSKAMVLSMANLALMAYSGVPVGSAGNKSHRIIEMITATVVSPEDGHMDHYSFPFGPLPMFAFMFPADQYVLIAAMDRFLMYDPNTPKERPVDYGKIKPRLEQLIASKYGPIAACRLEDKTVRIEFVYSN